MSLFESLEYNMIVETWHICSLFRQWYGIIVSKQSSGFGVRFNTFPPNSTTSFLKWSIENCSQPAFSLIYILIPSNNFGYYTTKNKISLQII